MAFCTYVSSLQVQAWRLQQHRKCNCVVGAMVAGPSPSGSAQEDVPGFVKRMEQAWIIRKQPKPVMCASCQACGKQECPWCKGTGFFTLGDQMLCDIQSHSTSCYICCGKGMISCEDCKGTGYRAKWLAR